MSDDIQMRQCNKCNEEKPLTTEFWHKNKSGRQDFMPRCKDCVNRYNAEWRKANQERVAENNRRWRSENREKRREYMRGYAETNRGRLAESRLNFYQQNRDRLLAEKRRNYQANPELYRARSRQWNSANGERKREYNHARYVRKREEILKANRDYYLNNRQSRLAYARQYRVLNRAKIYTANQRWWASNPEKIKIIRLRRRTRERSLPHTFTANDWTMCLIYFNYRCAVCGNQLRDLFGEIKPHADHWIALASLDCPGTTPGNMVCLCSSCNLSKQDTPPLEWLIRKFGKRKAGQILQRIQTYFELVKG